MKKKHYKSVFDNEQDLLKSIIELHLDGKDIECDPMYYKGNFYKNGINKPKYMYDIAPQREKGTALCYVARAENLFMHKDKSIESMILDPPFLFEIRNRKNNNYAYNTHTCYRGFNKLKDSYMKIIQEARRILKKSGVLIFKCQDYTDSKVTMTHSLVYNWATELGFYAKDIAILVKPNKVYNPNLRQRHLRKIHTYFWVFVKKKRSNR